MTQILSRAGSFPPVRKWMTMAVATPIQIRFERFNGELGIAPAKPPRIVTDAEKPALLERARRLLRERDAVLVAHYYVDRKSAV